MTDAEMFGTFFGFDRDENGWPKLADPGGPQRQPTDEENYRTYLRLSGISDKAKQDRLWAEERGRRRERADRESPGRRPRTAPAGRQRQHHVQPQPPQQD